MPHTNVMKKVVLERAWPSHTLPLGEGDGETGFPHLPAPGDYFANRLFLGGLRSPRPSRGRGDGEIWFSHPSARGLRPRKRSRGRGMGKPGFPMLLLKETIFTSAVHAAAPHTAAMKFLGGRSPRKPSHRAGAWGNLVFPHPSPRAYGHVRLIVDRADEQRLAGRALLDCVPVIKWGHPVSPCPCPSSLFSR